MPTNKTYALRYSDFVTPLVKAVQEQQKQIEELKVNADAFDELKKEIEELKKQISGL
jgi:type II secretory pathway component PulM